MGVRQGCWDKVQHFVQRCMRSNPPSCRGKSNPFNSTKGDGSTGCIPRDDPLGAEVLEGLIDDGAS
eukprot:5534676-Pyramimonas_sp.AAC.1